MRNIEVYYGDVLLQKFIWDNNMEKYKVKDFIEFTYFNPVRDKDTITKHDLEVVLKERFLCDDKELIRYINKYSDSTDYSIWEVININHLKCFDDFIWVKYEGDNTRWEDIAKKYDITENDFKGIIEGVKDLVNIARGN